jgi:hypothetical protein
MGVLSFADTSAVANPPRGRAETADKEHPYDSCRSRHCGCAERQKQPL